MVPFDLTRPARWADYVPLSAVQYVGTYGDAWEHDKARRLAAAGYRVVTVAGDPARRRSAGEVRDALRSGRPWEHLVPDEVAGALRAVLAARPDALALPDPVR